MKNSHFAGTAVGFASISVLIVDDDDFQRKLLCKMLGVLGIVDIYQAATAAAALEIVVALRDSIQVIISDLDMPDLDGMAFLRLLSEHQINAHVLILSSKQDSILRSVKLMSEEYGLNVLGAMPKPATLSALREVFTGYLQPRKVMTGGTVAVVSAEEISEGLEHGQFEPFFQPKVELISKRVCGVEALARWRHPERGILGPGLFIEVAERHGIIDQLTWMMLEKSLAWIREWSTAGLSITLSVNFSQASITDTRLFSRVTEAISRYGIPPEKLILEITETVVMTDMAYSLETLSRLRMKGFGLSIDDFGTGHSSLQQLSRVPYSELKIDQAFVTGAAHQPHLCAVAEYSVAIAKKLGLKSVGEGIETLDDWNTLQQLGCDIGQGYYIAKPMEGPRLLDWARDW